LSLAPSSFILLFEEEKDIERYYRKILQEFYYVGIFLASILKYWVKIGFNENFLMQNVKIKKYSPVI